MSTLAKLLKGTTLPLVGLAAFSASARSLVQKPTGQTILHTTTSAPAMQILSSSRTLFGATLDIDGNSSIPAVASRGEAVALSPAAEIEVPSVITDFNTSFMQNEEILNKLEDSYAQSLQNFSLLNGFYASSRENMLNIRSTSRLTMDQEAEVRKSMAKSIRTFMIFRGLPKFLKTRNETRAIAVFYDKTITTVANAASVSLETRDNWKFNAGLNPFTEKTWANYSNAVWKFEASSVLNGLKMGNVTSIDKNLYFSRVFRKTYSFTNNYNINGKVYAPGLSQQFNPHLLVSLSSSIPFEATDILAATTTSCALKYSF